MGNKEEFQEVLRRQYAEEIHEAYLESEHATGEVDQAKLMRLLGTLLRRAKVDGIAAKDFMGLVETMLPPEVAKDPAVQGLRDAAA